MSGTDRSMDCAEYVLGTLPFDERATLERDMVADEGLRTQVVQWEDWLAGLNDVIPDIVPAPSLRSAIGARIRPAPASEPGSRDEVVVPLRRSRTRWRAATLAFGALAAGLALFIARERLQPPPVSYLAVVDRGGVLPALIVHVDTATNTVSVRSLAAETPPDRVLQLWYIAGTNPPRSIGLLDQPETRAALPAIARGGDIVGATLAVSVEPPGGSPTGAPTGQVIYTGKLIRDQ